MLPVAHPTFPLLTPPLITVQRVKPPILCTCQPINLSVLVTLTPIGDPVSEIHVLYGKVRLLYQVIFLNDKLFAPILHHQFFEGALA